MRPPKPVCRLLYRVAAASLLLIVLNAPAPACSLCFPCPEKTAADYLIECPTVLLARESAKMPFSYVPVEILKGSPDGKDIDLLVDSLTRRRLADDEGLAVVLAQGARGTWHNLGLADKEYKAIVRTILDRAPRWQASGGSRERVEFFLRLFGHTDPHIFRLAYLEVGRAPYSTIKLASRTVSRKVLYPLLDDPQYIEWRPLAILMLAQNANEEEVRTLADSFHSSARFRVTTNLAALATAYVELKGASGVQLIEDQYFRKEHRKKEELAEVVKALSIHGTDGHTHLRDQILSAYAALLATHPEMAGLVARDLMAWKRFDLTRQLSAIADTADGIDPTDRQALRRYLREAARRKELR